MSAWIMILSATAITGAAPAERRINLVDFARVVEYKGESPDTLEVHELTRGAEGWKAWKGPDGQSMIGVEWDEPRSIAEVNIEFRHAIADRDKIQVQYWQDHWPNRQRGGWAPVDDPFHGQWVTAKGEWWAGDRDVSIAFVPYNDEQPGEGAPDVEYRRTYRLRFLCGVRELPPVRYLRAYGPVRCDEATFDIRLDDDSRFKPPLNVTVVNGYLLEDDSQTTMPSDVLLDAPGVVRVRFAREDLMSSTRTTVTVRDPSEPLRGFSFLPAEAVEWGVIRIPSLGVVVAHRGSTKDLQAGVQPGMSIVDRVAAEPEQTWERARREIPELVKTKQGPEPLYLPLGVPDARQEIAVTYDGNIRLDKSALKVKASDSERLRWPSDQWLIHVETGEPAFERSAEGVVKQRLLDDYLPVVINTWEHDGFAYEQTNVAGLLDEKHAELIGDETVVLLSRLVMKNTGIEPAEAVVRFYTDGEEVLALTEGEVSCIARVEDGKPVRYDARRLRFRIHTPPEAAVGIEARFQENASNAAYVRTEVPPGESRAVTLAVPFVTIDTNDERALLAGLDFDQVLEHERNRWRRTIERAARFETPNELLNDFYKAQLAHILITADRDPYNGTRVLPAATYRYGVCLNESCHQIRSLEIRGLHYEAEQFLEAFLKGQSSRGLHGRFDSAEGVFHGLPSEHDDYQRFNYNLDHGFALWMLNEHYRFTRDRDWLSRRADALVAACDFVTQARMYPEGAHTLAPDDDRWGEGLLPPGHLEDPPEWLWWFAVNAYAWRGMHMTGESLAEIRHPEAERITRQAAAFGTVLRESCREAMVRAPVVRLRDGTYVPHQPTRSRLRGRDVGWIRDALYGPVHLIDCGVYAWDSPEAEWILRDTEDNVFIGEPRGRALEDFDEQWFSWGGITLQSNLLPNPLVYLRRGDAKHAIRALFNSLAANVYPDVRTFCEHPIQAYGIGQGPFFKAPDESAFIVWLRHLLIMENGEDLDLLPGVPQAWLEPGQEIVIGDAPTWFGPVYLQVTSEENPRQIRVNLVGPRRNPPTRIRLHVRAKEPVERVTMEGGRAAPFDEKTGVITLPGDVGQTTIVIRLGVEPQTP